MKHSFITILILFFTNSLFLSFIACSKRRDEGGATSTDARAALTNSVGIVTAKEILPSLSNALNIDYSTATASALLGEYRNFASSLPKFGDHGKGFSGVMSRLITNFVYRSCAIAAEKDRSSTLNDRVVFRFIDISQALNSTTNVSTDRWRAFTKHIAYRFWGTTPSADEMKPVDDFADAIKTMAAGTGNAQTTEAANLICTLVGSSPRALFRGGE